MRAKPLCSSTLPLIVVSLSRAYEELCVLVAVGWVVPGVSP
jgi:hypothetical protein